MLQLQSRQISAVKIWLTQHCHHIALSLSPSTERTLSITTCSKASQLLSNLAFFSSPTRSSVTLPIGCSYSLPSSSASCLSSSLAYIFSSNCLHVSLCKASPQYWPASEGLHSTTSFRPLLDTSILCSGQNNLPKSVPSFYTSLLHGFSLREAGHGLLRGISVLKTLKADEATFCVV